MMFVWIYICFLCLLASSVIVGVALGSVTIPFYHVVQIFWSNLFSIPLHEAIPEKYATIIMSIRLPRVILAGIVGASLAITGAAFQGLLRNPLADPFTLGISSGASVGAVITIFFGISLPVIGPFTLPLFSIVASFITIFIVLLFARRIDRAMRV